MSLRKSNITVIVFFLSAIILNYCFYIIPITYDRYNVIIILIIGALILTKTYRKVRISYAEDKIIIFYFMLLLIQILLSSLKYRQYIYESALAEKYHYVLLMYFLLVSCLEYNDSNIYKLESIIILIGTICAILIDIQVLTILGTREFLYLTYGTRADAIRVLASANFIEVSTLFAFSRLLKEWTVLSIVNKSVLFISTIAGIINIFFVSQTRMSMMICLSIMSILVLVARNDGKSVREFVKKFVVILAILMGLHNLLNSDFVAKMLQEFTTQSVSVDNRTGAISFYMEEMSSSITNFLFGRGMIYDRNTEFLNVISGPYGRYNRSDIGFLGFLDEFGIFGAVWYVCVIINCFSTYFKVKKKGDEPLDLLALTLYFVFGSATICMMNSERNFMFPLLMFLSLVYKKKKLEF